MLALKCLLRNVANGNDYEEDFDVAKSSNYSEDFDHDALHKELIFLQDTIVQYFQLKIRPVCK